MRVIVAACLFAASTTLAQASCNDAQSNAEMKMCAERDWKAADAELNRAYAKALASARDTYRSMRGEPGYQNMPDGEAMLRRAQQAWISFRDANCNYQYQVYYGGTHAGLAYLICMGDMTKARLKELRQLPGGDEFEP